MTDRPNRRTDEGAALGVQVARLCESVIGEGKDNRCNTCAARAGDHIANGSPQTLLSFFKCAAERTPFWCHEKDAPCAGWLAMRFDAPTTMPWEHPGARDYKAGDVIPLPDLSEPRNVQ